jgi:hypothetical protein
MIRVAIIGLLALAGGCVPNEDVSTTDRCILKATYERGTPVSLRTWAYITSTLTRLSQSQLENVGFRSAHFADRGSGIVAVEFSSSCGEARHFLVQALAPEHAPDSEVRAELDEISSNWVEIDDREYASGS